MRLRSGQNGHLYELRLAGLYQNLALAVFELHDQETGEFWTLELEAIRYHTGPRESPG